MIQTAPDPTELRELVDALSYREHEGWRVWLQDDCQRDRDADGNVVGEGMTLVVATCGFDSYHPERGSTYRVHHYFIVPAATYNRDAWTRWLFDQLAKVELHECMEHFVLVTPNAEDGYPQRERPFAPLHGPGCDPYTVHQLATDEQRRTRFTGEVVAE